MFVSTAVRSSSALEHFPSTGAGETSVGKDAENPKTRLCGSLHRGASHGFQGTKHQNIPTTGYSLASPLVSEHCPGLLLIGDVYSLFPRSSLNYFDQKRRHEPVKKKPKKQNKSYLNLLH